MFFRIRRKLAMAQFQSRCRGIRQTEPIRCEPAPLKILSLVSHDDIPLYLLAIKTLYQRIGEGAVVILNDGSLTPDDELLLREQIRGLEMVHVKDIDKGEFPQGGCWERLLLAMRLCEQQYVIQVDSDTLTAGAVDEVVECYRANRAFLLGTQTGIEIVPVEKSAEFARRLPGSHLQIAAERNLDQIGFRPDLRYTRASAGFAGFPRATCDKELLRDFSVAMARRLGARWREWGSEQVASNFVLSNTDGAEVLPYPKYACFSPAVRWQDAAFLHFIGPHRFHQGLYGKLGQRAIEDLEKRPS